MAFDTGSISFCVCTLPEPMPADALEKFAAKSATSLDSVLDEPQIGWVSGRHLLETQIDETTAIAGGWLNLQLRVAQRKIPPSLFQAECRMAELARLRETQGDFLNRKQKKEIRENIRDRLLRDMPPTLAGIPFIAAPGGEVLFLGATSQTQVDLFLGHFYDALNFEPIPMIPEVAALRATGRKPRELPVLQFGNAKAGDRADMTLGRDFATWLWYRQEAKGGMLTSERYGPFGVMIDGPLVLSSDDPEESEATVRKGMPTLSPEARVALESTKKLRRANVRLARDQESWAFTLDADTFTFRGMRLPPGEKLDAGSHFQERTMFLQMFRQVFFEFFEQYLEEITETERLDRLQADMCEWIEHARDA